jgi:2-polyprenyl-6-methoxyphenol hydroxylase-like FAD-dependent oxidoreductase
VRLADGLLNIAAAFDRNFLLQCGTPAAAAAHLIDEAGWPAISELTAARWLGTVPLTRSTTPLAADRVFVIGDAASFVEPFTGEGMEWALRSAQLVSPWVRRAMAGWSRDIAAGWSREYRRNIGRCQRMCRIVCGLLHSPRLQRISMAVLKSCPLIAQLAISK